MTPQQTVEKFIPALENFDIDRALALTSPEIVYENVGLPPARGRAEFEKQMRGMIKYFDRFEVQMHRIAANGPVVLTERTDVIELFGGRLEPWVCGTFEVVDGRIVLWKDYFDWGLLSVQLARVLPTMLLAPLRKRLGRARA